MDTHDGRLFGASKERREDPALVRGTGRYTDNLGPSDAAHLAFARSRHAHAELMAVDVARATAMDGVIAAFTWDDIEASPSPGIIPIRGAEPDEERYGHPALARDRVRYHGEPVAAVVARDRYVAADAADAIEVEYDRLDSVVDTEQAVAPDAPAVHPVDSQNVAGEETLGDEAETDAAFESAAHVVSLELTNNRLIPNAIEPRAALAEYDASDDRLTVTMTSQAPFKHRGLLSRSLGLAERKIRVVSPDVGGGFGHKGHPHPGETVTAWAARQLDRPVRWSATRGENYLAGAHGRAHRTRAELALDPDGMILGLRVDDLVNVGAYVIGGSLGIAGWWTHLLASQYHVPVAYCRTRAVYTNTAPVHSYRGAGRPEAIYVTERLVDVAARELGVDPVELRHRNLIDPGDFPHETVFGVTYDSGEYERALDLAAERIGYESVRAMQSDACANGRRLGVGLASYVESTGGGFESGLVRVDPSGGVTVYSGTHSHGQGHETTYAQIVSDALGVPYDDIDVVEGDTSSIPVGRGTMGSRSAMMGGNAVAESARAVARKARQIAAAQLEVAPDDIEVEAGQFRVTGAPSRSVTMADIADAAYGGPRPEDVDGGLEETTFFEQDGAAYSFGTHAAVVEVDPETGDVDLRSYVAVDDCGRQINPRLVEGQVHGGVAQGIGQALLEHGQYDAAGNLATGSLMDYAVPRPTISWTSRPTTR